MSNVIQFPNRDKQAEEAEQEFYMFEERIGAIADLLDLHVQGMFHVMDVEPEELMLGLMQLSALWAVRGGIEADEFMAFIQSIHLEVTDDD